MKIPAKCNLCGARLEFDDNLAGQLANCPECKQPVDVPSLAAISVRTSKRSPADIARHSRAEGTRRVADYFAYLGTCILVVNLIGAAAVFAVGYKGIIPVGKCVACVVVLILSGVFNFFLWRAVYYVLNLLADIETNTRSPGA